jgi:hypothetical protein
MLFAKRYLLDDAAATWDQICAAHPEDGHTWAAMKELLYSRVAPTKHCTEEVFQKLRSARQGPDQMVTSFGAYIITTSKGINIIDHNKRIFFCTRLHPEIRAAIRKG